MFIPFHRKGASNPAKRQHRFRPQVEMLEWRALPSAGTLDPTFGNGGIVTKPFGTRNAVLAVQADGKLVEAANVATGPAVTPNVEANDPTNLFEVLRQNPDGSADSTFGSGGSIFVSRTGAGLTTGQGVGWSAKLIGDMDVKAIAVEPDGKILVAGDYVYNTFGLANDPIPEYHFFVARFNSDGTVDSTFGTGGLVITGFGNDDKVAGIAVETDGTIVVAGTSDQRFALVRYNADGSPDTAFGTGGTVITAPPGYAPYDNTQPPPNTAFDAYGLALQSDGKIIVAGAHNLTEFILARYNTDGTLESTFGTGGLVESSLGGNVAVGVAVQANGDIVASIWPAFFYAAQSSVSLARFTPDGQVDSTFGQGGEVDTHIVPATFTPLLTVALQADGKILLASDNAGGTLAPPLGIQDVLERYNADGSIDSTFGSGGHVVTMLGQAGGTYMTGMAFQPDGRIIVAGDSFPTTGPTLTPPQFTLAGFTNDGQPLNAPGQAPTPDPSATAISTDPPPASIVGRTQQTGQIWVAASNGQAFSNQLAGTWSTSTNWQFVMSGDFNGDGTTDLVARDPTTGLWYVSLSNGSTFAPMTMWDGWSTAVTWADVHVADVTGDGKDDIVGRDQANGQWYVAISTGSAFYTKLWAQWSPSVNWQFVQTADLTGDGKADIVGRDPGTGAWWAGISTGTQFLTELWGQWSTGVTWVDVHAADLNGDGKADLVGRVQSSGEWWAGLSTGAYFNNVRWAQWSPAVEWTDVLFGDLSGDGKADIVARDPTTGTWWASLSTGMGTTTQVWDRWSPAVTWVDVQLADVNGDGKADIVGRDAGTGDWWAALSTGSGSVSKPWGQWSTAVTWLDVHAGNFSELNSTA